MSSGSVFNFAQLPIHPTMNSPSRHQSSVLRLAVLCIPALILSMQPAIAQPVSQARCARRLPAAQMPAGASGLYFDRGCDTAYVAPPAAGKVQLGRFIASENLSLCDGLGSAQKRLEQLLSESESLLAQVDEILASQIERQHKLAELEAQVELAAIERDAAYEALSQAQFDEIDSEAAIAEADDVLADCLILADTATACDALQRDRDKATQALQQIRITVLAPAILTADEANAKYEAAYTEFSDEALAINDLLQGPLEQLQQDIEATRSQIASTMTDYGAIEAAYGRIRFTVDWAGLVQAFQEQNRSLSHLKWTTLPLDRIQFDAQSRVGGRPSEIAAVVWAKLPGQPGVGSVPDWVTKEEQSLGSDIGKALLQDGRAVDAWVGLSLAGACPYAQRQTAGAEFDVSAQQLTANVVANVMYGYSLNADRQYEFLLNLKGWEQFLQKTLERKGTVGLRDLIISLEELDVRPLDTATRPRFLPLLKQIENSTTRSVPSIAAEASAPASPSAARLSFTLGELALADALPPELIVRALVATRGADFNVLRTMASSDASNANRSLILSEISQSSAEQLQLRGALRPVDVRDFANELGWEFAQGLGANLSFLLAQATTLVGTNSAFRLALDGRTKSLQLSSSDLKSLLGWLRKRPQIRTDQKLVVHRAGSLTFVP